MDAFQGDDSVDCLPQSHLLARPDLEANSLESDTSQHPTRKRRSDALEPQDTNPSVSTDLVLVAAKKKLPESNKRKHPGLLASSRNTLVQIPSKKSAAAQGQNSTGERLASRKSNKHIEGRIKIDVPNNTKKARCHGQLQQKGPRATEAKQTANDVSQVDNLDIAIHRPAYLHQENAPGKCLQLSDIDAGKLIDAVHRNMRDAVLHFMKQTYGEEDLRGGPGCQVESNPGPELRRLYQCVFGESSWFKRYMTFENTLANSAVLEGLVGAAIYERVLKPAHPYPELTLDLADWKILVSWIKKTSELSMSSSDARMIMTDRDRHNPYQRPAGTGHERKDRGP
ncbi:hypothetical protein EV356DRAFT_164872 [Viridothelium virens]|uniref:Uncharacterized protein n=1 Tax=Viridothelium virens TaxID=1048519 RepID=A0A6A6HMQ0_VIRVR|nr:hypothetical protein EV356DRAFT_164872 [Viridothelium virens]